MANAAGWLSPEDPFAQTEIAICDFLEGRHGKAIARLEQSLPLARSPCEVAYHLVETGFAYYGTGRLDTANARFRDALERAAGVADERCGNSRSRALVGLGSIAIDRIGSGEAERLFRQALSEDPAHADATLSLVDLLMQDGRVEEAISELEAAVACEPDDPQVWKVLGDIAAERGDHTRAAEAYGEAALRGDRGALAHVVGDRPSKPTR